MLISATAQPTVAQRLLSITGIQVTINALTHPFIGDLTFTLQAPNSKIVSLFGKIDVGNDFTGGNLSFSDSFTSDLVAAAFAGNVFSGNFYASADFGGGKVNMLDTFGGDAALGNWTLKAVDSSGGDIGSFASWNLTLTGDPVSNPVPGPLPLAGAAAAMGWARRLRSRSKSSHALSARNRSEY